MKALVFDRELELRTNHPEPRPAPGEALIRVRLAGICGTDLQIVRGYAGFRGVLGHEFVGDVLEGSPAWRGRRVVGEINCVCGACDLCTRGLASHCRRRTVLGILNRAGAFAERLCLPERNLHAVPDGLTDEEAVFTEPLAAACQVLRQCPIDARMRVAVLGAGRLGLLVAQLLRQTGCALTVIGRDPAKLAFCDKQGIQSQHVDEVAPRGDSDVVVECSGAAAGLELAARLVRPRGTIVLKSTCAERGPVNLSDLVVHEITVIGSRCGPFAEALQILARRDVEVRTLVTRVLGLSRACEAFAQAAAPGQIKVLIRPADA